jgi:tRNA(Ile)-lysidine synthase TilS/MesJ
VSRYRFSDSQEKDNISALVQRVKARKRGEYDSILGLSGGVDSSYIAFLAMCTKLKPLCVHFDNGWNSDVAVKNIRKIIDVTGFDLYTYVIDWKEFRDLQRSFIMAGVVDIEMLTDHAIFASLFRIGKERRISTVLSGTNFVTEHGMPRLWSWNKMDLTNIKDIQNRFGQLRIKSFPTMRNLSWLLMRQFGFGGVFEEPLNCINYSKSGAIRKLVEVFDWEDYGGKHYESIFTKFYQAYILPQKFLIDKRMVHYSALIRNKEITRVEACDMLKRPLYDAGELKRDKLFVLKKLGFSESEFDDIMKANPIPHDYYKSDVRMVQTLKSISVKMGIKSKLNA